MAENEIREDVAAAFDKVAEIATPEPTPEPVAEAPVEAAPEPTVEPSTIEGDRPRDPKGRFAKVEAQPEKTEKVAVPQDTKPTDTPAPVPQPVIEQPPVKAPQSWKPAVREHFAKLTPDVQQEVLRREQEITRALQESSDARQGFQKWQQTVQPYEPIMRSMGADPYTAVNSALQGLAVLASGPPGQKAQLVANLVRQYGVDIQALDSALSGQGMPNGTPQQAAYDPSQIVQAAKAEMMRELEQARAKSHQEKAAAALKAIEGNEFFEDVREDIADVLIASANRGVAMTPQEAYNRAVWMNPHTAEVMQRRKDAQSAANANVSTQRAKVAASSVKPSPAAPLEVQPGDSLRDVLEAAYNRASR